MKKSKKNTTQEFVNARVVGVHSRKSMDVTGRNANLAVEHVVLNVGHGCHRRTRVAHHTIAILVVSLNGQSIDGLEE
jgi:hypothetical protein